MQFDSALFRDHTANVFFKHSFIHHEYIDSRQSRDLSTEPYRTCLTYRGRRTVHFSSLSYQWSDNFAFVQVGGSLAKVVYFTRSPEPPSSPSIIATNGGSVASNITTPESISPPLSPAASPGPSTIHGKRPNGALTPLVLDSHNVSDLAALGNGDFLLRETLIRRASLKNFPGGSLNFERFETDNIDDCVRFIQRLIERSANVNGVSVEEMRKGVKILATGGGAHKFYELFRGVLDVEVRRQDEMECLIEGLNFITMIPDEVYYFSDELVHHVSHPPPPAESLKLSKPVVDDPSSGTTPLERPSPNPPDYSVSFVSHPTPQLPCLLVNIGSGVSLIKVEEDGRFERVSGTSLGGGTLWGLLSMLTPARTFDGKLLFSVRTTCF